MIAMIDVIGSAARIAPKNAPERFESSVIRMIINDANKTFNK